jgi:transposase
MDYFAGLDISMDETMFAFSIAKAWWLARARPSRRRRRSPANWRKRQLVVASCSKPAPILFHGLNQLGLPVVCVESRQAYQALKSLVISPTRPTAMTREVRRIWPAQASSSPCM